jgi:hypothetical protein
MFIFGNSIQQDTVFQIKDGPKIPVSGGPVPFCSVECLPSPFTFIPPQQARLEIPLPSKLPGGMLIPVFRFDSRLNQYVAWVPAKRAVVRSTGPLAGWIAEADVDHFSIIALCFDKDRPRRFGLAAGQTSGGAAEESPPAELFKVEDEAPPGKLSEAAEIPPDNGPPPIRIDPNRGHPEEQPSERDGRPMPIRPDKREESDQGEKLPPPIRIVPKGEGYPSDRQPPPDTRPKSPMRVIPSSGPQN